MGGDLYAWNGERQNITMFNPHLLYFIIPNLAVGGNIGYSRQAQGDTSISSLNIGPAAAYFFKLPIDKLYPYAGAGVLFTNSRINYSLGTESANGVDFYFGGGVAYMLGKNIAATLELNYHIQFLKPEGEESEWGNIFVFAIGFALFLY